jgi:hypothetical protein
MRRQVIKMIDIATNMRKWISVLGLKFRKAIIKKQISN